MNKIYKVIWSKTRNCYVAVSEIAKRNGKSCTSVNCEGKANRSRGLRMAALTLSVAAALVGGVGFGTPAAWADGSITISDANNPMGTATGGTVTSSSGYVHPVDPSINELNVVGGKTGNYYFAGYYSSSASGTVSGYTLNISGSDTQIGMGQYSGQTDGVYIGNGSCTASGNKVNVTGGAVAIGEMAGAKIKYGTAQGNEVTINNSMANHTVIGGYFTSSGVAIGNTVTVSGIKEGKSYTVAKVVYGGGGKSGTAGVKVVDGNEVPDGNKVIIKGSSTVIGDGTSNGGYVYGGSVDEGSGAVKYNSVEIEGSTVKSGIYGGYTGGSGSASNNKVTISGGTVGGISYGGYSYYGSANKNIVNISGNSVTGVVYGGATSYGYNSAVDQTADGNQVTISGSAIVEGVTGGYSYGKGANSHANGNIVTVSGKASTGGILAGGSNSSSVSNNQIIIKTENSSDNVSVKGQYSLSVTAGDAGYTYNSDSGYAYGDANGNSITVSGNVFIGLTDNGQWNDASITAGSADGNGNATDNHITIEIDNGGIGKINDPDASATYSITAGKGDVATGNTVEIKKGKINVDTIYGAYGSSKVQNNKVTVSGMNSDLYRSGTIYGGRGSNSSSSENVLVSRNRVVITGGKLTYSVFGGYAGAKSGKVTDNHVNISGEGTELKASYIVGGEGSSNEMEVSDNHVTISDGASVQEWTADIYGGYSSKGPAKENTVAINGEKTVVKGKIYGGTASYGDVIDNVVTIDGATLLPYTDTSPIELAGGYSGNSKNVSYNKVNIDGGNIASNIYGGYGERAGAKRWTENEEEAKQGKVSGNVVTIAGGTLTGKYVIGGFTQSSYYYKAGDVKDNIINVSGGTVTGSIFGGVARWDGGGSQTESEGIVSGNKVNISGTAEVKTKVSDVYGGYTGPATGYVGVITEITENSVTLSDNASANSIYGGYADVSSGKDNVHTNTVTISGGTVNGYVYGGYSSKGSATNNTVKITGGTVKASILGGGGIAATGNKVEISGTETVIEIDGYVYGGNTFSGSDGSATGNTVTLGGVTVSGTVYGGIAPSFDGSDVVTGNTLVLSKANNTIAGIKNFETIKLADTLVWSDGATVLKANNFEYNAGGTRSSLNITDAEEKLATATSGQMALLASDKADNFATLSLIYSGGTVNLNENNPSKELKSGSSSDSEDKGVTFTSASTHTVSLDKDNSYKNVLYKVESSVSKIALGPTMTWDTGRVATAGESFANVTTVDASALKFTDPEKASGLMALVSGATGLAADMNVTGASHTQDFTTTAANGATMSATLNGVVATVAGAVNYVVTDTTVKSVDLAGWDGTSASVAADWKGKDGGADVTTGSFTDPTLAAGQKSIDILTATTENFFGTVTGDKEYKSTALNKDTGNGVKLNGEQASGVKAEDRGRKLTYYAVANSLNSVDLADWNGSKAAVDLTDWTLAGSVAVETDGMKAPGTMQAGDKATIIEATGADFTDVKVNGAYVWTDAGPLDKTAKNGVSIEGTSTGGGVKGEGAEIYYQKSKNQVAKLTLGEATFTDKGTARAFGADDDLTTAVINADGLTFTNTDSMKGGQSMVIVDASDALKNANNETLKTFAKKEYKNDFDDTATANLQLTGSQTDTLTQDDAKTKLTYNVGDRIVKTAVMSGDVAWSDGGTYYTNENYTFNDDSVTDVSKMTFTSDTDPLAGGKSMTLIENAKGTVTGTPDFAVKLSNTTLVATAAGNTTTAGGNLGFTVTGVTLDTVAVTGAGNDAVPSGWAAATDVTVDTDNMTVPTDVTAGEAASVLTTTDANTFANSNIKIEGENGYKAKDFVNASDDSADATKGVTVSGTQSKGVLTAEDAKSKGITTTATGKNLVYAVSKKEASAITLGTVKWAAGSELLDGSSSEYNYGGDTSPASFDTTNFDMNFDAPEKIDKSKGESMTLLKANDTLKAIVNEEKTKAYTTTNLAEGVTLDAHITGQLTTRITTSSNNVVFTPTANQADTLTFGSVKWDESAPLMTRPSNIVFDGAKVVTTDINFYNINEQYADKQMTLVKGFDGTPSGIEGTHYTVGSGLRGEGSAEMYGSDLIFKTKTGTERATEATHETVMAMEAGTAVVATGREFVGSAIEGLGKASNMSPDGTSTFAAMGGGSNRYKTGSHVNTHTWNALVAVGSKKEHKKGDMEWGVFAEYGRGNYTLHDDNGGRGDGDTHYAGGGLLAKWTNKHDVYTEASFRLGRMSDSAKNMLADNAGNRYGYNVHANYYGFHVGLGKIYKMKGNHDLDVYGKFFYTKRNGVNFDAGGNHYDLDSVNSSLLRIGARYGSNDKKWNWYGGLAYEYEFDGDASGTVSNGGISAAIRSASIKGSSVRGELGMRMDATKTNPWKADIGIYGYGGKHRGFGGTVSVAYMF